MSKSARECDENQGRILRNTTCIQTKPNKLKHRFLMTLFHDSLFALMLLNTHNLTSFFSSHMNYISQCV